jgi:hypothetical protein
MGSIVFAKYFAGVVKLVDTGDLKSPGLNKPVPVQVRSPANKRKRAPNGALFLILITLNIIITWMSRPSAFAAVTP